MNLWNDSLPNIPVIFQTKPDRGKSCICFKKPDRIPFELIAGLTAKMTADVDGNQILFDQHNE